MSTPQKGSPAATNNGAPKAACVDADCKQKFITDYIAAGFSLVATRPNNQKRAAGKRWNEYGRPASFWAENPNHGVGVLHGPSGTCTLDLDDLDAARIALAAVEVDMDALLAAPDAVQIVSGRPNRAKLVYRVGPHAEVLSKLHQLEWLPRKGCILELRAGAVQDVLPPSVHPGTGQPYEWQGDWRNLPEVPAELVELWADWPTAKSIMEAANPDAPPPELPRHARGPRKSSTEHDDVIGQFNDAHDIGALLDRHGYKRVGKRWLPPNSTSGVPGVMVLDDAGKIMFSYNGSCALADGKAHDAFDIFRILEHNGDMKKAVKEAANLLGISKRRAPTAAAPVAPAAGNAAPALPPLPDELADLPDGLGFMQGWIVGRMPYPCRYVAGWTALATLTAFAQTSFTVASQAGLGFNEYFLTLAPSGFGKEAMRDPLPDLVDAVLKHTEQQQGVVPAVALARKLPIIEPSAPASAQGLHLLLEEAGETKALPSVFLQSDEFSTWLKKAGAPDGSHIYQALSYIMQIYGRALRTAHPGRAAGTNYTEVRNPRFSIFSTTTPESAFDSMTRDLGEMGAYNRFVTFLAPDEVPNKRYTGLRFEACPDAVGFLHSLLRREPAQLKISAAGFEVYMARDKTEAEPIRQHDTLLGARLSEQAIKLAGLLCLARGGSEINGPDMATAYNIRLGLYQRAAAAAGIAGAGSGRHETAEALEQIRASLERRGVMYKSELQAASRRYRALPVRDRHTVLMAAFGEGWAAEAKNNPKKLVWTGEE